MNGSKLSRFLRMTGAPFYTVADQCVFHILASDYIEISVRAFLLSSEDQILSLDGRFNLEEGEHEMDGCRYYTLRFNPTGDYLTFDVVNAKVKAAQQTLSKAQVQ